MDLKKLTKAELIERLVDAENSAAYRGKQIDGLTVSIKAKDDKIAYLQTTLAQAREGHALVCDQRDELEKENSTLAASAAELASRLGRYRRRIQTIQGYIFGLVHQGVIKLKIDMTIEDGEPVERDQMANVIWNHDDLEG